MRKPVDPTEIFLPNYDGKRHITAEEAALRDAHDPLWLGYVSEFMKNPELLDEQDNIDRLLKDINDYLHLVWNKKNFPKDYYLSEQFTLANYDPNQTLIPQISFVSNRILDGILSGSNKFEALRQIFLDRDFCQFYEKFVGDITHGPFLFDTFMSYIDETYKHAVQNNDAICLLMLVQTLGAIPAALKYLDTQEEKDQFKQGVRAKFNAAMQNLRAIGDDADNHRGRVADTFEEIWQNFTITQFDPPTKAAGLQGGNR